MTTEKKDKPEAKPERTGTEYVVLEVRENGYGKLGSVVASNDTAAISAVLAKPPKAGKYIAVPSRSFRVREVTVSTVTQTKVN